MPKGRLNDKVAVMNQGNVKLLRKE